MCDNLLNPSGLRFLWKHRGDSNYDVQSFVSNGIFIQYIIFEDQRNYQKVLGKIVMSPREGEAYHWPRLHHESLAPLIDVVSINEKISVYISPLVGNSLKNVIHSNEFMSDPQCFNRKRAYAEDILWALDYLHSRSLCLMNLTELAINICSVSDKAVICDFSRLLLIERATKEKLELPALYQAPELKTEYFDPVSAETWACGVIFLQMFTKHYLPSAFIGEEARQVLQAIKEINYDLIKEANPTAQLLSSDIENLRQFLHLFLVEDPNQRVDIRIAATSSFVCSATPSIHNGCYNNSNGQNLEANVGFEHNWKSYRTNWLKSHFENKHSDSFKDIYQKEVANCRAKLQKFPCTNKFINLNFVPDDVLKTQNNNKELNKTDSNLEKVLPNRIIHSPKQSSETSAIGDGETTLPVKSYDIPCNPLLDTINQIKDTNLDHTSSLHDVGKTETKTIDCKVKPDDALKTQNNNKELNKTDSNRIIHSPKQSSETSAIGDTETTLPVKSNVIKCDSLLDTNNGIKDTNLDQTSNIGDMGKAFKIKNKADNSFLNIPNIDCKAKPDDALKTQNKNEELNNEIDLNLEKVLLNRIIHSPKQSSDISAVGDNQITFLVKSSDIKCDSPLDTINEIKGTNLDEISNLADMGKTENKADSNFLNIPKIDCIVKVEDVLKTQNNNKELHDKTDSNLEKVLLNCVIHSPKQSSETSAIGDSETTFPLKSSDIKCDPLLNTINEIKGTNLDQMSNNGDIGKMFKTENKTDSSFLNIPEVDCKVPSEKSNEVEVLISEMQSFLETDIPTNTIGIFENSKRREQSNLPIASNTSDLNFHSFKNITCVNRDVQVKKMEELLSVKREINNNSDIKRAKSEIIVNPSLPIENVETKYTSETINLIKDNRTNFYLSALASFVINLKENDSRQTILPDSANMDDFSWKNYVTEKSLKEKQSDEKKVPQIKYLNFTEASAVTYGISEHTVNHHLSCQNSVKQPSRSDINLPNKTVRELSDGDFSENEMDTEDNRSTGITLPHNDDHSNCKLVRRYSYKQAISQGLAHFAQHSTNSTIEAEIKAVSVKPKKNLFGKSKTLNSTGKSGTKWRRCKKDQNDDVLPIRNILLNGHDMIPQQLGDSSLNSRENTVLENITSPSEKTKKRSKKISMKWIHFLCPGSRRKTEDYEK